MAKNIEKYTQRPNRKISTSEELKRYESIFDYYLNKSTNDAGDFEISVSEALKNSPRNWTYLFGIMKHIRYNFEPELISETFMAKADFIQESVNYFHSNLNNIPLSLLNSYANLLEVLDKEDRK